MRILFLDIDGVLNSLRSCAAFGGFPMEVEHIQAFDQIAIRLLQRFCDSSGVQIILSSTWRLTNHYTKVAAALGLPIIGATGNGLGPRGRQIQKWLDANPEVEQYAILDDNSDMLPEQLPRFVKTDGAEGMSWKNFEQLCSLFGESPYSGAPRHKNWEQGKSLDWDEE